MKVSIIIPVYNVEKYLEKCLDSVINQTYKQIEIIIINDGSNDATLDIIKKYSKENKKIKYISQKNSGQSIARNKGLSIATGDYIMFVDGDDYIDESMVEELIKPCLEDKEIEISFCDYYLDNEGEKIFDYVIKEKNIILKKAFVLSAPSPCLKLFKREILENFKFPENIIYEDLASIPILLAKSNKIFYVRKHLYYYRQHSNSTTRNMKYNSKKMDIIKASQTLIDSFKADKKLKEYKQEIEFLIIQHLVLMGGLRFSRYPKPKQKLKMIKQFINENKIDIKGNIYYHKLTKERKKLIKIILNANVIGCYIFFIKRKLKIGGYNEI